MAIHERDQDLAAQVYDSENEKQALPEQPEVVSMTPTRSPEYAEVSSSSSARSFGLGGTSNPCATRDAR